MKRGSRVQRSSFMQTHGQGQYMHTHRQDELHRPEYIQRRARHWLPYCGYRSPTEWWHRLRGAAGGPGCDNGAAVRCVPRLIHDRPRRNPAQVRPACWGCWSTSIGSGQCWQAQRKSQAPPAALHPRCVAEWRKRALRVSLPSPGCPRARSQDGSRVQRERTRIVHWIHQVALVEVRQRLGRINRMDGRLLAATNVRSR